MSLVNHSMVEISYSPYSPHLVQLFSVP